MMHPTGTQAGLGLSQPVVFQLTQAVGQPTNVMNPIW